MEDDGGVVWQESEGYALSFGVISTFQPRDPTRGCAGGGGGGQRRCGKAAGLRRRRASAGQERLHVAPITTCVRRNHGLVGLPRGAGHLEVRISATV